MTPEEDIYMTNDMPIIGEVPKTIEGELSAEGYRFPSSWRFNSFITSRLLAGALDALQRHGEHVAGGSHLGTRRLRNAARRAEGGRSRAHRRGHLPRRSSGRDAAFRLRRGRNAKGIAQVSLSSRMPVIYGVITADTTEQAIERAGTKAGNKGYDAAVTAIEMVNLLDHLEP